MDGADPPGQGFKLPPQRSAFAPLGALPSITSMPQKLYGDCNFSRWTIHLCRMHASSLARWALIGLAPRRMIPGQGARHAGGNRRAQKSSGKHASDGDNDVSSEVAHPTLTKKIEVDADVVDTMFDDLLSEANVHITNGDDDPARHLARTPRAEPVAGLENCEQRAEPDLDPPPPAPVAFCAPGRMGSVQRPPARVYDRMFGGIVSLGHHGGTSRAHPRGQSERRVAQGWVRRVDGVWRSA